MPQKRRAERFEMQLPVRYHLPNAGRWANASTMNVSRNGVLARAAAETSVPEGLIDFIVVLPPCGIVELARIRCRGRLVRVVASAPTPTFALSIDRYHFMKPGEQEDQADRAAR